MPFGRITRVTNDQIIHIHVSKSLVNISALASHLSRPPDASFKDLWRGFTVSSPLASRLSGIPWDISRGASAYLSSDFGAFLLVLRSGAIRESEKDQWSYNDRNGYKHLHPPAKESKHQREKRSPEDGLADELTLYGPGKRRFRRPPPQTTTSPLGRGGVSTHPADAQGSDWLQRCDL